MAIEAGTRTLGPEHGKLTVQTGRSGGAAKAGHDLLIDVTAWSGTVKTGAEPSQTELTLNADSTSLRVREGKGGIKSLDEGDKDNIRQTIDQDVLKRTAIAFHSTAVEPSGDAERLVVRGELELFGQSRPVTVDLQLGPSGRITGAAVVKQTEWGIKPYSALFGALKVGDEVRIQFEGQLPVTPS